MSINKRPFLVNKTAVTPQDSLGKEITLVCEKRTRATIKRLNQTPGLLHTCGSIIKEQEERGFIEKISDTVPNHNVHYIPHHPVKKDSPTTPSQIVLYWINSNKQLKQFVTNRVNLLKISFLPVHGITVLHMKIQPIFLLVD